MPTLQASRATSSAARVTEAPRTAPRPAPAWPVARAPLATPPPPCCSFSQLGWVAGIVDRRVGSEVDADAPLMEAGLDSLGAVEFRNRLAARLDDSAELPETLIFDFPTLRQIEAHITNTMGWSATTGDVAPWVYQQLSETFVLDEDMRRRLAELNPVSAARLANRLIEAQEREYWGADDESIDALRQAGEDLEDFLEGVTGEVAA